MKVLVKYQFTNIIYQLYQSWCNFMRFFIYVACSTKEVKMFFAWVARISLATGSVTASCRSMDRAWSVCPNRGPTISCECNRAASWLSCCASQPLQVFLEFFFLFFGKVRVCTGRCSWHVLHRSFNKLPVIHRRGHKSWGFNCLLKIISRVRIWMFTARCQNEIRTFL